MGSNPTRPTRQTEGIFMTNMEMPSVSLFIEYQPMTLTYKLTAELKYATSKLKGAYQLSNEQLVLSNVDTKYIITAAVEEMTVSMTKAAPWIDYGWLRERLVEGVDAIVDSMNAGGKWKSPSASAGTHDKGGSLDINTPLNDWEKKLLADAKKNTKEKAKELANALKVDPPMPKGYVEDKPKTKGLSQMADGLPGMTVELNLPCDCPIPEDIKYPLKQIIMHINDEHAPGEEKKTWTSDELCDWLDMLHDTGVVNLEVEIPDKEIK